MSYQRLSRKACQFNDRDVFICKCFCLFGTSTLEGEKAEDKTADLSGLDGHNLAVTGRNSGHNSP